MIQDMSTIYGFKKQVTRNQQGSSLTLASLMGMLRSSLGAAWEQARTSLRLASDEITARPSRDYGSCPTRLRLTISLLLMLTLGSGSVWGQTDYSGVYYIASRDYVAANTTNNFYLCPTENWYYYLSTSPYFTNTNNDMPFMTTYKCRNGEYDARKAVWIIEKKIGTDFYYIKQAISGYYLTYNVAMGQNSNAGRMRIHLEASPADDDALFQINYVVANSCYEIITKKYDTGTTRKYLNVTGQSGQSGNINSLVDRKSVV